MNKKIFKSIFIVAAAALVVCVSAVSCMLYGYFEEITEDELKTEAAIISNGMRHDENYLDDISGIKNRITLVAGDGSVLFDSWEDKSSMENHGDREEIAEAVENGEAFSVRYSDTLSTKTIYYAVKLDDGSILRIAQEQDVVMLLVKGIIGPVILMVIIILILASIVSRSVSRRIVEPINALDIDDPDAEEPYPELSPLMRKIRKQRRCIDIQMTELERQQTEFANITDHMDEGFVLIGSSMDILSYNKAALKLLGEDAEAAAKPNTAYELNRSAEFRSAVEEALSGVKKRSVLETDGRRVKVTADPVTEGDEIIGAVIIIGEME